MDSTSKNTFLIALHEGRGHLGPRDPLRYTHMFLACLLTLWSEHYQKQAERHLEVLGGRSPVIWSWHAPVDLHNGLAQISPRNAC